MKGNQLEFPFCVALLTNKVCLANWLPGGGRGFLPVRRNPERKKEEEKCRGCFRETDNNYTCPRRPREPDHVAIETQVQQKVTGKSIQIELISPSLPSHLTGATKHILTVAALMQHKPQQCLLPPSFSFLSAAAMWIIRRRKKEA